MTVVGNSVIFTSAGEVHGSTPVSRVGSMSSDPAASSRNNITEANNFGARNSTGLTSTVGNNSTVSSTMGVGNNKTSSTFGTSEANAQEQFIYVVPAVFVSLLVVVSN